jgi:hypothetical protein
MGVWWSAGCAGLVGAVVLPVTGAVIGSTQIIRGIINTPEAIIESGKGKIWNHVRHFLPSLLSDLLSFLPSSYSVYIS